MYHAVDGNGLPYHAVNRHLGHAVDRDLGQTDKMAYLGHLVDSALGPAMDEMRS